MIKERPRWDVGKLPRSNGPPPVKGRLQLSVDMSGQVFLSGVVATEADKRIIEEEARNTPGVSQVHSDIRVQQGGSDTPPPPPQPVLRVEPEARPAAPAPAPGTAARAAGWRGEARAGAAGSLRRRRVALPRTPALHWPATLRRSPAG